MMKIYESILDDLENNASGEAAKKLRDDTLQKKSKDDYDFTVEIRIKNFSQDLDVCATDLTNIRDRVADFLESCPSVTDYGDVDFLSSWFEINKYLLKNAHRVLYRRPDPGQEYKIGFEINISFSFRRPINVLYFLGQLYNVVNISTTAIKLHEMVLIKNGSEKKKLSINYDLLKYLAESRREKIWPNVTYDTLRELVKIANFIKPCLAAYYEVAKKFDAINFNETSFVVEAFRTAAYNLNKKIVIPGYLYVQMEDAEVNADKAGKLNYYWHNLTKDIRNIGGGEWDGHNEIREWEERTFFEELSERPRKPYMIYAHAYKNIYLHIFITFDAFYDEKSQTPYLFAIDCSGYVLDEELIGEFAHNICHNIFNDLVRTSDFIKFIKETFPENYAKLKPEK